MKSLESKIKLLIKNPQIQHDSDELKSGGTQRHLLLAFATGPESRNFESLMSPEIKSDCTDKQTMRSFTNFTVRVYTTE